ncbi:hypothetical protein ACFQ2K_02910 [Streptomyces sanglieri]|uniref:Secreted protein/lipoprotein n=1 Tax=Streptomyces sanglieri TaxID=193460 RepID=A0ABW2WL62_9ACTN
MTQSVRPEHSGVRERNRAWSATLLTAACVLATVTGCSSGKADDPKETPTPSASAKQTPSKPADPNETAKNEAIATYTSYWQEMERSYAKGSSKGTSLKDYAAGSALASANTGMANMLKAGQATVGHVVVRTPTATQADIHRKIPNVRLSSCLDVSQWKVINRDTRNPVVLPSDRLTRYVVVSVVEKWPAGWRVIRDEPQEKSC